MSSLKIQAYKPLNVSALAFCIGRGHGRVEMQSDRKYTSAESSEIITFFMAIIIIGKKGRVLGEKQEK